MTALNGRNEGKWQLGLTQSCPSTGEKEALTVGLHHRLSWRRKGQLDTLLQGSQRQHYDILSQPFFVGSVLWIM